MIHVYYADVSPLEDDTVYLRYYGQSSEFRRSKADRFRFKKDRELCAAASALIDCGLREYGLREADISYSVNENGKPFIANAPDIHFNLSHSGQTVMVCFSDSELGCDIEKTENADIGIAKRFFHPNECCSLLAKSAQEADEYFCTLWTLKESYIKAVGSGLSMPMNSFEIKLRGDEAVLAAGSGNIPDCHFRMLESFQGYKAAVCSAAEPGEVMIEYVQL